MKPASDFPDQHRLTGDRRLCAWATSESSCRIQSRDPQITKALRRLPDCVAVGYSVSCGYLRIFALPYTLRWVAKNVIEKLIHEFPRKNEGSKTEFGSGQAETRLPRRNLGCKA